MSKLTFTVEPQRPGKRGFEGCEPHRATRFAVIRKQWFKRGSTSYVSCSVVHHCTQRADAEAECSRLNRAHTPLVKRVLGGRFGPLRGKPIAVGAPASFFAEKENGDD